jgi:hypothetical protein
MAVTFFPKDSGAIELNDFMAAVHDTVDPDDIESIEAVAPLMKQLGNNRWFVAEKLNEDLKHWPVNALSLYSLQAGVMLTSGPFTVCMVLWPTLPDDPRLSKLRAPLYSYYDMHDHNFLFMTVGYYGPGYVSKIYEYDSDRVVGYIGEKVDIKFLEETALPMGKVMYYRPFRDIHTQLPPTEFSMSINLLVDNPKLIGLRDQYYFDSVTSTITGYVESNSSKRISQLDLIRFVGDDNSIDILWSLAKSHPCKRTRLTAMRTIAAMRPDEAERAQNLATSDSSELVRRGAALLLEPASGMAR